MSAIVQSYVYIRTYPPLMHFLKNGVLLCHCVSFQQSFQQIVLKCGYVINPRKRFLNTVITDAFQFEMHGFSVRL